MVHTLEYKAAGKPVFSKECSLPKRGQVALMQAPEYTIDTQSFQSNAWVTASLALREDQDVPITGGSVS